MIEPEAVIKQESAAKQDPWANRPNGMTCRTCVWFLRKEPAGPTSTPHQNTVGRCRRHAPSMGGYPVVYTTDWCGDHRIDENKI